MNPRGQQRLLVWNRSPWFVNTLGSRVWLFVIVEPFRFRVRGSGSSRDGTSLVWGDQGLTHPSSAERVGRAGSHGSTADTPVLFR